MFEEAHLSSSSSVQSLIYIMHMCAYIRICLCIYVCSVTLTVWLCVAQSSSMPGIIISVNLNQIPLNGAKRMSRIKHNIS